MTPIETVQAQVLKALRTAWRLGQVYWQQADSDSYAQHKKADETKAKFDALVSETCALLAQETAASRATECEQKQPNTDATQAHLAVNGRTPGLW